MKIANKISFSFFITAVLLTGIAAPIFYLISRDNLKNAIYSHLVTAAQSRGHHIRTYLIEHKEQVMIIADSTIIEYFLEAFTKGSPNLASVMEKARLQLKKYLADQKIFYEIFIISRKGKIILSTDESRIGLDKSTDAYFLGGKKGPYIKDVYYSETTKREAIAISSPVLDGKTKEFLGVVVVRLGLADLNEITTDRTGLGKTGEIYLINKYGYMITESRFLDNTFLRLKVDTKNTRKAFEDCEKYAIDLGKIEQHGKEYSSIFKDYRGVQVLGTHSYIPETRWILVAEIDAAEALAPLVKIKFLLALMLFIIPIAAGLVGIVIARIITEPIHKLHRGTEMIGRGNLDYKVAAEAKDEIGQLSRAFDAMIEDLKESTTSIDKLNKEIAERKQTEKALKEAYRELKETQSRLIQSEKLAALGRFSSGFAHEIKNPLGVILAGIEFLEMKLPDAHKRIRIVIKQITESTLRANTVVCELLKFARPSELKIEKVNLHDLIDDTISLVQCKVSLSNIKIKTKFREENIFIEIDRNQMQQVLFNVLVNAAESMLEGGVIKIRVYEVMPSDTMLGKMSCGIEIRDAGEGISKDNLSKIFEPFFTTKIEAKGTGLGLSMAKMIVENHRGSLQIESELDKGTVVKIILPVVK